MLPIRNARAQRNATFLNPEDYQVIWIAPLEIEARAALCLLDERHKGKFPVDRGDDYVFHAGSMCGHNIVIATLPAGQEYGTGSAAALASQAKKSFRNSWFGLLVGVAAGLPNLTRRPPHDIRLGDVLVGLAEGESAGLLAYDLGKETSSGFQPLQGGHVLAMAEPIVRSAIGSIKIEAPNDANIFLHYYDAIRDKKHANGTFADPGQEVDRLFLVKADGTEEQVQRVRRLDEKRTRVWYGPIGAGDKLSKDARRRDELRDRYDLIGLEMEAAGIMNRIPVGVIRGVCDYGDAHKNKEWQPYAAAMAAAFAKAVLAEIQPSRKFVSKDLAGSRTIKSETAKGPYYHIQLSRNPQFTGRIKILNKLDTLFFGKFPCQRVALVGLCGVGKTQVALHFAYKIKESRPDCSILWIPVLSDGNTEQAFVDIARKIGLEKKDNEDIKELVCQYLSSENAGQWLLVVDAADDYELVFRTGGKLGIEEFLPRSTQGLVLLTTRSEQVAEFAGAFVINVEQMSHEEAVHFLKKSLNPKLIPQDEEIVSELLARLTYLPLAIAQAVAYLRQSKLPVRRYLGLLEGAGNAAANVLGREFKDISEYPTSRNAVTTTWLVSFEQIRKSEKAAIDLLLFLSCIEPKAIPESMLPKFDSAEERQWAISVLCRFSFLVRRGDGDVLDMHSPVHLAIREWVKKQGTRQQVLDDAISHLSKIFPSYHRNDLQRRREYLPHALHVLAGSYEHDTKERADLCIHVGWCLQENRRLEEAMFFFKEAESYGCKHLPEWNPTRIKAERAVMAMYINHGQANIAVEILQHVAAVVRETMMKENPYRLACEHELASAYIVDNRVQEAIMIFEEVVTIRKTTLPEVDHERLKSEHELGKAYLEDKRGQEAIEMLEHVLTVQKNILPAHNYNRLASEYELGRAYLEERRVQEAIGIFEHVLAVRKILPIHDHDRLSLEYHLGKAYLVDKRDQKAIEMFEHVLTVQKNILPAHNHNRLASECELGRAYLEERRVQEAIGIFEYVVAVQKMTLSRNDLTLLSSQVLLATAYMFNNQKNKALGVLGYDVTEDSHLFDGEDPDQFTPLDLYYALIERLGAEVKFSDSEDDSEGHKWSSYDDDLDLSVPEYAQTLADDHFRQFVSSRHFSMARLEDKSAEPYSVDEDSSSMSSDAGTVDEGPIDLPENVENDLHLLDPLKWSDKLHQLERYVVTTSSIIHAMPDPSNTIDLRQALAMLDMTLSCHEYLRNQQYCGDCLSMVVTTQDRPGVAYLHSIEIADVQTIRDHLENNRTDMCINILHEWHFNQTSALLGAIAAHGDRQLATATVVARVLELAMISFAGAHLERFDEKYLNLERPEILLYETIVLRPRPLSCLHDYLNHRPVWVFEDVAQKSSPCSMEPLYVSTTMGDFASVWGPVWTISQKASSDTRSQENLENGPVLRYNVGLGSVIQWSQGIHTPPLHQNEILAHWTQQEKYIIDAKPFSRTSAEGRLLIGARPKLSANEGCQLDMDHWGEEMHRSGRRTYVGTHRTRRERDSQTISAQIGGMGLGVTYQEQFKIRGTTLKERLLCSWTNEPTHRNPSIVAHHFGVEISACSGNARRRRLARMLGSSTMRNYLKSISTWSDETTEGLYFQHLNMKNIRAFETLWRDREDLRKSFGDAVAASLGILLETGTSCSTDHSLKALWSPSTDGCWTVIFPHSSCRWTGLLSDTSDSCTVARITQKCLIIENSKEFGCQNTSSVLETAMAINPRALKKDFDPKQLRSALEREEMFDLGSSGQLAYISPVLHSHGFLMSWLPRNPLTVLREGIRETVFKKNPLPCHWERMLSTDDNERVVRLVNVHVQ